MGSCRLRCACILGRCQFRFFHSTGIEVDDFLLVHGVHHMSILATARKSLFLAFLGRDALSERNALRCTSPFNFEVAPQMNKEHFMVTHRVIRIDHLLAQSQAPKPPSTGCPNGGTPSAANNSNAGRNILATAVAGARAARSQ
jgi:hypothetical protein